MKSYEFYLGPGHTVLGPETDQRQPSPQSNLSSI